MPYHYTDPTRQDDPHALPDVEAFFANYRECPDCCWRGFGLPYFTACQGDCGPDTSPDWDARAVVGKGWFYAFGFPGCLWDSEPVGPFDTEDDALAAAREDAS